jgi:regulator of sigma E protease
MNLAVAIGGLAFLILIHEAGHFFVARAVAMRPRKFYIFFPPALAKWKRGGIEYGIGAIPLGGYVKIPGMHRPAARDADVHLSAALEEAPWIRPEFNGVRRALEEQDLDEARAALPELRSAIERSDLSDGARRTAERGVADIDDALSPDAYWRAPAWKRIVVILAGPAANLVFAVVMLAVVFALGVPAGATRQVERTTAGSPAAAAGLESGDVIVAVAGEPTPAFGDISDRIRASGGEPIVLTVRRDGGELELGPVTPTLIEGRYRIGFVPEPFYKTYSPGGAIAKAFVQTGDATATIFTALGGIITGSTRDDVSSAVGIVEQSSQVLDVGFRYYLGVLALISLSLALLNLLPLLPLDGGHIAFSIAEKIRGRAIPRETYERFSMVGIALVLVLFFIGLSNDIDRLRGG